MNEFVKRTLSGAIYVSLVIASIFLGQMSFTLLLALFLLIAVAELGNLLLKNKDRILIILLMLSSLIFFAGLNGYWYRYLSATEAGILLLATAFVLSIFLILRKSDQSLKYLNLSILWLVIPFFLLSILMSPLRTSDPFVDFALAIFVFIWVNDTFAYLSGSLLGSHLMFPSLSPKKTWEGFVGGLLFSILAAMIWANFFEAASMLQWIIIAVLTSVSGTMGDFFESKLKRQAGVKDAGNIIPGHGGVLDRLDSILFAAPAVFLLIILFFAGE